MLSPTVQITLIALFGGVAQWIAWRIHIPSIVLLLAIGAIAGPLTGMIQPDPLFGQLLFPFISISVGLILFEGGLTLNFEKLKPVKRPVVSLVSIGILVTWVLAWLAAWLLLGLSLRVAALLGAILTVSGPTVILPMLRHIRPSGQLKTVLKWEGILVDPIGAVLALLVLERIVGVGGGVNAPLEITVVLAKTAFVGLLLGVAGAAVVAPVMRRFLIPDYLLNPFVLTVVLVCFTGANELVAESGLLTTTVMGVVLANSKSINLKPLLKFKETIGVLLISSLFIILVARLDWATLSNVSVELVWFLALLIFVIRPVATAASTIGSSLSYKERLFLGFMAPRGIVAASVSSLFALELIQHGDPDGSRLVTVTFAVIATTVVFYGLIGTPLANWLGLSRKQRNGVVILGADEIVQRLAEVLEGEGFATLLVDSNRDRILHARRLGFQCHHGDILSETIVDELELEGMGTVLAMTTNDKANCIATLQFSEVFNRANLFQYAPRTTTKAGVESSAPLYLRGRTLFAEWLTAQEIARQFRQGATIEVFDLGPHLTFKQLNWETDGQILPMLLVDKGGELQVFTPDKELIPNEGDTLIAMIPGAGSRLPEIG